MSHRATTWAREQRGLKPATKIVLWVLADYANGVTCECYPSRETIADEAEVSIDSVDRHVQVLIECGLVTREKRTTGNGKTTSYAYRLNLDVEMMVKHLRRNRKSLREGGQIARATEEPQNAEVTSANCPPTYLGKNPDEPKEEPSPLPPSGEPEGHFDDLEKEEPAPVAPHPKPPSDGRVLTRCPLAPDLAARFDELLRRTEPTLVAIEKAFGPASWRVERNYRLPEDDKGRRRSLSAVALRPLEPPIGFMIEVSTVLPHTVERLSRFPGLKVVVVGESDAQAPTEGVDVLVVRHIVKRAAASVNRAMVFVRAGSPQAEDWIRHGHKATLWKYYPEHRADGWWFPSEWPPGRGPPDVPRGHAPAAQPAML